MTEPDEKQSDQRIGRVLLSQYRIDALLGEGGMGSVYRAEQLSVNRPVAIKLIAGKIAENPECVRRFRREAEAMAKLRHPNTVRLYEFGVADQGELFMVMELLEGSDLAERLAHQQRLAPLEALIITRQVLEALGEAHALGIVHRDLKPANIFLSNVHGGRMIVKVMDFGIAGIEQTAGNTKLTMAGAVMGTPAYMSPEQAQGKAVDPRSDLYSLGVVLFEMLVGKPPFEADSAVSLLLAHVSTSPPRFLETNPGVQHGAQLQALLDSLLHKNPAQRPGSVQATLERVDALLRQLEDPTSSSRYAAVAFNSAAPGNGVSGVQATVLGGSARYAKVWGAVALSLLLVCAFWLWPRGGSRAVEARAPAPPSPSAPSPPPAPAAAAVYAVQILSKPAGATLELAGVEIGKTPYELQFRRSTTLRVQLAGHAPKTIRVDEHSDPLFVVELEPLALARSPKGSRRSQHADEESATDPKQALAAPAPLEAAPPAAPVIVAEPLRPPVAPSAPIAAAPTTAPARPPIVQASAIPPPAWLSKTTTLSARDRRQLLLQRGPAHSSVAAAKRAYRAGQISEDLYDDTVWVLKSRRNDRIQLEKQRYKSGSITRDEYDRRVARIDAEYEGQ